ncbi:glutamic-type intramembrane protease PrsW [Shouchella shacheensis]|uniref:glutamic-type intramembrane protease PrsW n=1 Tax=Shouchella shacheensis TaxID=1649580 RepID=UPI00073FA92E|nr:glutamic-type intramembrane protease PrsW [Shouchella shacheensis]
MFALITAALAPIVALLSYVYLRHAYSKKMTLLVLRTFVIGVLLVIPILVLQYAFTEEGLLTGMFSQAFILYGFTEEFFKWLLLFVFAYQHGQLQRPSDGIVFGVSISLGFASLENILFLIAHGLETAIGRALMPVAAHAIYGIVMGYYIGHAKHRQGRRLRYLLMALLIPVMLHSVYDLILILFQHYFLVVLIPFMALLWMLAVWKMRQAQQLDNHSV